MSTQQAVLRDGCTQCDELAAAGATRLTLAMDNPGRVEIDPGLMDGDVRCLLGELREELASILARGFRDEYTWSRVVVPVL